MSRCFSIIIVTTNSEKHILNCISSIKENLPSENYEIILSDNSSTDGTVDLVKRNYPNVKIIVGENKGYGFGINRGISLASFDYFLVLNDDIIFIDDSIFKMVEFMEKEQKVGLMGPQLLNLDLSLQRSITKHPTMWWMLFKIAIPRKLLLNLINSNLIFRITSLIDLNLGRFGNHKPVVKEVDGVKGACMMFGRKAIIEVGLFDEKIFLQTEESDIAKRLQLHGFKVFYYPFTKIVHVGGETTGKANDLTLNKIAIQKYLSDLYFFRKYRSRLSVKSYTFFLSGIVMGKIFFHWLILLFLQLNKNDDYVYKLSRNFEAYCCLFKCLWFKKYKGINIFLDINFKYL